jgi:hypothetical protein
MRNAMPVVIVYDRFVEMTSGHALSCVLHGRDSGHIGNRLCAIQCRNPEPEIPCYMQARRIHRVEQRRKRATVTVDDGRISLRMCCFPSLSPGNRLMHVAITFFAVENPCSFRVSAVYVNMDVWYPTESGESFCRPLEISVAVAGGKLSTVDGNVCGRSAVPHDPSHLSPLDPWFTPP